MTTIAILSVLLLLACAAFVAWYAEKPTNSPFLREKDEQIQESKKLWGRR